MRTAVALVAVVLLAGCSLLGGGPGTPTGASPNGTDGTPDVATMDFPPGYSESGVTNASAALETNTRSLLDAGSFYVEYNGTAISGDRTATSLSARVVNLSQDRAYVISRASGSGSRVQYYAGDRVYVQNDPPGENNTEYDSWNVSVGPRDFAGRELYGPLLEHAEWGNLTMVGENQSLLHYQAQSLEQVEPVLGGSVDRENVTDFRGSLLVGPDGTIHQIAYGATIERETTSDVGVIITTRKVGNTTVEPPTWLDEAR